jgi:hypothetical protein
MLRRTLIISALLAASAATAQAPAQLAHIRGAVTKVTANSVTVKPKSGPAVTVGLAPNWTVTVLAPVDPATIKPGSFIGTTNVQRPDGSGRSLEVHVFPPGVRMGEGHYGWDLKPKSMMTNGDVGKVVAGKHGRELEVSYAGGTRHIVIPPNVPVVGFTPGSQAMVKPGVKVFIIAGQGQGGALMANSIAMGANGAAPPM